MLPNAKQFAEEWLEGWNAHNLDAVLSHYADDFVLRSPMITVVTGNLEGELKGKEAIRAYWAKALQMLPQLHFTLEDVLVGEDSIVLVYQGHRGRVAEYFRFNDEGFVAEAAAHYLQIS